MDYNLLLTVLGLGLTIIFGWIGIRMAKKYRASTKLVYYQENCLSLYDGLNNRIDGLSLSYNGKSLDRPLFLLKGSLINYGNNDIDKPIIHKPVEMEISEEYQFHNVKLITCSPNVMAECQLINENKVEIKWELLKPGEYISYDILFTKKEIDIKESKEVKENACQENIDESIKFNHRITNLREINREKHISNLRHMKSSIKELALLLLLNISMALWQIVYSMPFVVSKLTNKGGNDIVHTIQKSDFYIGAIAAIIFLILSSIIFTMLLKMIRDYIRDKKIYKLIKRSLNND